MINPTEVNETIRACLAPDVKGADVVVIDGIMGRYALSKTMLDGHRDQIKDWLDQMAPQFHKMDTRPDAGGGWSFLNFCTDAQGNLWTGLHQTCEELIVLGMGLSMVEWCLPREMWSALPGGMPYLTIDTTV